MKSKSAELSALRQTGLSATLRASRIFSGLPMEDIEAIAKGCETKPLKKGELLFREGVKAEGFFIIQSGQISIFRLTKNGRRQIIHVFRAMDSFAEVVLATDGGYPANAIALQPSQVVLVKKTHLVELLEERPKLALRILASMSVHLKQLVQTLQDLKGRQVEGRLAAWLLRHTHPSENDETVTLGMSKTVLAGQLGVTSETLSRTFARFRNEKILAISGKKIQILKSEGLLEYAEGRA